MADTNLKQTMGKEWQKVRKHFHYPQLPEPQLVDNIPNGMFDMENLEVKVSEPFIKGFEKHGISSEESLNECLTHELTHFMKYPGSILNVLRLQKVGQGVVDADKVSELRTAFTEAQTNLYMLNEVKHPATAKMRKAYGLEEGDAFNKLMYGLYQDVSGQDFGVKLKGEEKGLVEKLKDITFLDKKQETHNFKKFAQILKDYQPPQQKKKQGEGQGQGGNQGNSCSGAGNSLEGFTDNQIREGLRQFAQECFNPEEYEEIVKQVLGESRKKTQGQMQVQQVRAKGLHPGSEKGITELANNFYTALSEKYTIPIRKKQMHKNGTLYPHSHTGFEVGDTITDVDAFSTPGILPGITKKWVRKEGEVYSNEDAVPDSFIVIDSSGSMPNPVEKTSIPVLGATAISNAYLKNDSRVGAYNFSAEALLCNPTKDREQVHKMLRTYQNGGTVFHPEIVKGILQHYGKPFDMSVISDMAIGNLEQFVKSILALPKSHRVHLFYTQDSDYVNHVRRDFGDSENVAIMPLTYEKDIEKITMGELKKSVK